MDIIARQNLITVLGKVTAFYEPMAVPYLCSEPAVKKDRHFPDREEWEKRLTRKVKGQFADQLRRLLEHLGDPPSADNIPVDFWDTVSAELRRIFEDTLTDIALDWAESYLEIAPIGGVDWMQVNQGAVDWARHYSFDLVRNITDSQRQAVSEEIRRYYADGHLTIDDIGRALEVEFGERRAEMIAVTETTRAAVEGDRGIVDQIEGYGIKMKAIWRTANDDVTCEVCGSKDGEEIEGDDFPPAHTNCRCGVSWEVAD
jgi:hypothetical protein